MDGQYQSKYTTSYTKGKAPAKAIGNKKRKIEEEPTQYQEIIEVSDESSDSDDGIEKIDLPTTNIKRKSIQNLLFNALATFKVRMNSFERKYDGDPSFAHVNESHDIYQTAIDEVVEIMSNFYMCSE